nr:nucleotidyltransferase family protein [Novosphingobium hassiacum]
MALLDEGHWVSLVELALSKRAGQLVRRAVSKLAFVPAAARAELDNEANWYLHYGLQQKAAIRSLFDTLDAAGFSPIWLKGLSLAMSDYPDAMLRPMRDVDALLPLEDVVRAQTLLLDSPNYRKAPWAGNYGVEYGHQMPEIQDTRFDLTIELHHRVNARNWEQEGAFVAFLKQGAQVREILGRPFRVPSTVGNFLHLTEHATLHHMFENGSLTLADLHFIATRHALDWDEVAREAERFGLRNALGLVAATAHSLGATWVPQRLLDDCGCSDDQIEVAYAAMLLSSTEVAQSKLLRRFDAENPEKSWTIGAALARALQPNPYELARIVGCEATSPLRFAGYPAWLWNRGRIYRAATAGRAVQDHATNEAKLLQWMRKG